VTTGRTCSPTSPRPGSRIPPTRPRPGWAPVGILSLRPHGSGYQLRSKDDFADFELRLDFALAPGADSGVFLRARRSDDDPEVSGCEVQIADDHVGHRDMKRPPWALTGTLLGGIAPAVADALGPPGSWNTLEIRCAGSTIRTRLNGFTLYEVDTTSLKPSQGPPFSARAEAGFVGLQGPGEGEGAGDAAAVSLRNVFVRRVPR
jgi:hypothetical protein